MILGTRRRILLVGVAVLLAVVAAVAAVRAAGARGWPGEAALPAPWAEVTTALVGRPPAFRN